MNFCNNEPNLLFISLVLRRNLKNDLYILAFPPTYVVCVKCVLNLYVFEISTFYDFRCLFGLKSEMKWGKK